ALALLSAAGALLPQGPRWSGLLLTALATTALLLLSVPALKRMLCGPRYPRQSVLATVVLIHTVMAVLSVGQEAYTPLQPPLPIGLDVVFALKAVLHLLVPMAALHKWVTRERDRKDLVAYMAHDLRSPTSIILNSTRRLVQASTMAATQLGDRIQDAVE